MRSAHKHDDYLLTLDRPVKLRMCDHPGCSQAGDYRAPKDRQLENYYWFCLDHVRAYNAAWDFFSGMSTAEVEAYNRKATVWERPSWPMADWQKREQALRDEVAKEFFGETFTASPRPATAYPMSREEQEALTMLELTPPVDYQAIRAQYKILVKRYHPDLNGGSPEAEEKFKLLNQSFAVLRAIYEPDANS
jgi:hypothetical protein